MSCFTMASAAVPAVVATRSAPRTAGRWRSSAGCQLYPAPTPPTRAAHRSSPGLVRPVGETMKTTHAGGALSRRAASFASRRGARVVTAAAADDDEKVPFGYTRLDVMLIGVGITGLGFGMYYGLQSMGMDPIWAGNWVQITFVLGLTIAWVGSYVSRVFNKDMTYVKQLKDYEDAVMAKRLEELPEAELEKMMEEISKLDPP